MKKYIFILLIAFSFPSFSQNNKGKADDEARIILATYVSDNIRDFPVEAKELLKSKLDKISTASGMGGSQNSSRFIITANVDVVSKNITPTAPTQHMFSLEVSFYIGDAVAGTKFSSCSKTFVGVGVTEIKAYKDALTQIKPNESIFNQFIADGKTKIIEYYNSNCDFILKEAQSLSSQSKFDEAIGKLTTIPEVCKVCYDKAMDAVGPIYQKQIDKECKLKLAEANNAWNTNQDSSGAATASESLAQIDPNATCFKDAQAFSSKIAKRIQEIDKREWSFKMKEQQDDIDIRKATIKAARDIGVAYGNHQPKTVYKVYGWW